jgi:hypothetical protein
MTDHDRTARTRRVEFRKFRGTFASWDDLCAEAAAFATKLTDGRLISISHSADHSDGLVVVWFWEDVSEREPAT